MLLMSTVLIFAISHAHEPVFTQSAVAIEIFRDRGSSKQNTRSGGDFWAGDSNLW